MGEASISTWATDGRIQFVSAIFDQKSNTFKESMTHTLCISKQHICNLNFMTNLSTMSFIIGWDFTDLKSIVCAIQILPQPTVKPLPQPNYSPSTQHNYINHFLDVSSDTVFTVIVTISIFGLGLIFSRLEKRHARLKKEKNIRRYYLFFIENLIDKTCPKLRELYRRTYLDLDIDTGIPLAPPKILTRDFVRISQLPFNDLFYAINERDNLSIIQSHTDFIMHLINEIEEFHKRIRYESDLIQRPLQTKANSYVRAMINCIDKENSTSAKYPGADNFQLLLNRKIFEYHTSNGVNQKLSAFVSNIVIPLQNLIVEKEIHRNDKQAMELIELGKDILIEYGYIRKLTVQFRLDYRKFSQKVENSRLALITAKNGIDWS